MQVLCARELFRAVLHEIDQTSTQAEALMGGGGEMFAGPLSEFQIDF